MRKIFVRIVLGDWRVTEVTPQGKSMGRIVYLERQVKSVANTLASRPLGQVQPQPSLVGFTAERVRNAVGLCVGR